MFKPKHSQAGLTLVEVSIALAIAALAYVYALGPKIQELRLRKAENQATQLLTVSNAVATYMTRNYGNLVAGTAVQNVVKPYEPTLQNLRDAGLLLPNFSDDAMYAGAKYAVKIERVPATCTPPDCDLAAITYLTKPITNSVTGRVDGDAIGAAATVLDADGGWSRTDAPGTIKGPRGSWSVANPLGNVAGILAMRSGYGSSGLAQFMRRDGTLPATGTQDMGGQDVKNVATLRSTTIANSGDATVNGQTYTNGLSNSGAITNTGALTTNTAAVTGALTAGSATVSGAVTAGSANVSGALTAGNATVNGTTTLKGATTAASSLSVTGTTTLSNSLSVSGATIANGITNNGTLLNKGDITTNRVYLTTIVSNGQACAGYNGYQASTAAGSIASCINGTWQTPSATIPPPSPCNSTTVSWQGCTGTVPYTVSGNTASVTVTSGSGSATYSCNNGSWAFQSGNCVPPPAGCPAQNVYWSGSGASCSGYSSALSHGGGHYVSDSNGIVYVTCSNGSLIQSSPSCSKPVQTYYNPTSNEGYALASNPTLRANWCGGHGRTSPTNAYTETDYGGTNMTVCWTIDGNGNCTGKGNCSGFNYGNPGCWIQTKITCS